MKRELHPFWYGCMLFGAVLGLLIPADGCSVEVAETIEHTWQVCTDTRDDETFRFHTSTISDASWNPWGDTCFKVEDDTGRERTLCKSHEAWMKCGPAEGGQHGQDNQTD